MDNNFISGLFAFAPSPKSPDFVKAVLSVKPDDLIKWLEANKGKVNEKGFLPVQILQSQKGGWYAKLNEWKKTEQGAQKSTPSEPVATEEISPDDIPW